MILILYVSNFRCKENILVISVIKDNINNIIFDDLENNIIK